MADEETTRRNTQTIPMIAATEILRPKGARVGHIGNINLPRPILIKNLFAGAGGAMLGAMLGVIFSGVGGVGPVLWGAAFCGGLGVFIVTYSPLQGEPMWRWLALVFGFRRKKRLERDGKPVRPAIGIAPVVRVPDGWVRVRRGAVNVPPSQYDERGVLISEKNRNLDRATSSRSFAAGSVPARPFPGSSSTPQPVAAQVADRSRPGRPPRAPSPVTDGASPTMPVEPGPGPQAAGGRP